MSIYSFSLQSNGGQATSLKEFQGKTLLFVNVASKCGFTPQYAGLEDLHNKYKSKGLVILGIPCNQFGAQEPGTDAEIKEFCSLNYNVTFQIFAKTEVNGENENKLYTYLKAHDPATPIPTPIKWNFTKFLVDKQGNVVKRFLHSFDPKDIAAEIEAIL